MSWLTFFKLAGIAGIGTDAVRGMSSLTFVGQSADMRSMQWEHAFSYITSTDRFSERPNSAPPNTIQSRLISTARLTVSID